MDIHKQSVDTLARGYAQADGYTCIFCEAHYAADEVYRIGERFFTAEGMVKQHIAQAHGSPFEALLALDKKSTGLSDVQVEMLRAFYAQTSDAQIVAQSSSVSSVSTVRQHRFKLREKEKQAKIFLAIMQQLSETPYTIHKGATQVDERYSIETQERQKVLATYFKDGLDGEMTLIPSKEKKKLVVLAHIVQRFDRQKRYDEKEVNAILKTAHADFVSLRRHLIEYGFMDRSDDGAHYWVKL